MHVPFNSQPYRPVLPDLSSLFVVDISFTTHASVCMLHVCSRSVLSCSIFHKQLDSTVSGLLVSNYIFMLCAPVLACNLPRFAIGELCHVDQVCLSVFSITCFMHGRGAPRNH